MPQRIRGGRAILDQLETDRRAMSNARHQLRQKVRDARKVARWDAVQVEILLDQALDLLADMGEIDDRLDQLIAGDVEKKLTRRARGEAPADGPDEPDLIERVDDLAKRLAWLERAVRSPHFAIEPNEARR